MTTKKILAALDFSKFSQEVVNFAADFARRYDASLTLLHVADEPNRVFPEGFVAIMPARTTELLNLLEMALADAKKEAIAAGATNVSTMLVKGVPFAEIAQIAQDKAYDTIIVGTHGRTGLMHALLGSVAEKVVRSAPCTVITVRDRAAAK
ncbi:MAG: universal stress protein [Deltaproteobacteria bacterium]|nr:universal stress protein [Deltaproteobacteria bacterium]